MFWYIFSIYVCSDYFLAETVYGGFIFVLGISVNICDIAVTFIHVIIHVISTVIWVGVYAVNAAIKAVTLCKSIVVANVVHSRCYYQYGLARITTLQVLLRNLAAMHGC